MAAQTALIHAYKSFVREAKPYINISSEQDYEDVQELLATVMEEAEDSANDPMNPLIDMLSHAIEVYESQDDEIMGFVNEAESMPKDIALLRALMQNYELTGSDLPEIGDKTYVSKVLNHKKELTRGAIERLAERFGLRPSMFLE